MPDFPPTENHGLQAKPRFAARLLLIALTYFASGRLGLAIPYVGTHITLIWLPTGIAVAALLRWGYGCWPGIFLGAVATNFSIDSSPLLDSSIALGNTLGPLLAAWLLQRLKFHGAIDRAYDILFLGVAAAIGMLVSAGGGVGSLVMFKALPMQDAGAAWLSWWVGDFVGVLLATPLLLNITRAELAKLREQRLEFLVWCLVTILVGWEVFLLNNNASGDSLPLAFVMLPLAVWSAARFGVMGSSLGALLPVIIAAWATSLGLGPFHTTDAQQGLFLLWLFFATLVLIGLMVEALQAGRKRAEENLRQSESQLRAIIEAEPECVKLLAADGTVLQMNPAGLRMLEADTLGQIVGQKALEIVAPHHQRAFAVLMRRVFEGEPDNLEFEAIGLKGTQRWLETHAVPMRDAWGKITALLAVTRDITERKCNEKIIQAAQRHEAEALKELRVMFDTSGEGLWKVDQSVRIVEVNDAYCRIAGYARDEVVGAQISKFEFIEQTPEVAAERMRLIAERGYDRFETKHRHRDGHMIDLEVTSSFIAETNCFIVLLRDVTGRKRFEETLRIAAATFETQEAILITDPDANILRVNHAFEHLSGYRVEEVIGKNPRIFQSGRYDRAFYQAMWSELLSKGKWSGELWDKRKNGEIYPKHMTITAVYDDHHQLTHYVAVSRDISQLKQSEQKIHQLAFYDPLTKLPNRRLLLDRLQQAMAVSMRSGRHGALLFLDMDRFKDINDTLGHATGDLLLIEAARRLQSCVREGDSVARLGGDEFVVVLEELSHQPDEAATQTELVAEKIRNELCQPYMLKDYECHTTPSIGVSMFRGHLENIENLLKHADVAMYQAKAAGRNAIRFFDPQMQILLDVRAALEADLRQALARRQFHLYYQIQMDSLYRPLGAEVLLRWEHPERGMVSPMQFIPLAEETGLIVPIGLWVMQTACAQLKTWQRDALTRNLMLAVNVSAKQFRQADFVAQVQSVLLESGVQPSFLKLELTESTVLESIEDTIARMHEMKMLGVSFSMDDFGTGYSSLQYLKRLPLDQIKIDQSFVRNIPSDPNDAAIVQTIIAMTQALGLNVIAEGVETEAQRDFLDKHGCHAFQGYLLGKPMPVEKFEASLGKP